MEQRLLLNQPVSNTIDSSSHCVKMLKNTVRISIVSPAAELIAQQTMPFLDISMSTLLLVIQRLDKIYTLLLSMTTTKMDFTILKAVTILGTIS